MTMIRWCKARMKKRCHAKYVYAGRLVVTDLQRTEQILTGCLWLLVVAFAGCLGWQTVAVWPVVRLEAVPAKRLSDWQPASLVPLGTEINGKSTAKGVPWLASVFDWVTGSALSAASIQNETQAVSVPIDESVLPVKADSHVMQQPLLELSVQRVSASDSPVTRDLLMGQQALRQGHFDAARLMFDQVLQHDAHQVVALAGMFVVTSQRGELELREAYLTRLRQEVPEYMPNDDLFLLTGGD